MNSKTGYTQRSQELLPRNRRSCGQPRARASQARPRTRPISRSAHGTSCSSRSHARPLLHLCRFRVRHPVKPPDHWREPFISRLPFTYAEADRVISEAVGKGEWVHVERERASGKKKAQYRVCESRVTISGEAYRAIVVNSDANYARRQKKIERELSESLQEAGKILEDAGKIEYYSAARMHRPPRTGFAPGELPFATVSSQDFPAP